MAGERPQVTPSLATATGRPATARLGRFGPRARRFSRAHSRIVGLLKLLLPLAAAVLIGAVVFWPRLHGPARNGVDGETAPAAEGMVRMVSPRFASRDREGQPYSIAAEGARESPDVEGAIALDRPSGEITLNDGAWIALLAQTGEYRDEENLLILRGDVRLYRDDGTEFMTEAASIDLGTSRAWGDRPVHTQGPDGQLDAEGFEILDGGQRVIFTGRSTLLLRGAARGTP